MNLFPLLFVPFIEKNISANYRWLRYIYISNKIIKNNKPDIINTWMYHSSLILALIKLMRIKNNIPIGKVKYRKFRGISNKLLKPNSIQ